MTSVVVKMKKGIVDTEYKNASKTDRIVEFAPNTDSRLNPIPKVHGNSIKLKDYIAARYFDDGHLQCIQFTRKEIYYLIFVGKGIFRGCFGKVIDAAGNSALSNAFPFAYLHHDSEIDQVTITTPTAPE